LGKIGRICGRIAETFAKIGGISAKIAATSRQTDRTFGKMRATCVKIDNSSERTFSLEQAPARSSRIDRRSGLTVGMSVGTGKISHKTGGTSAKIAAISRKIGKIVVGIDGISELIG
jgi:hypothetical protein